MAIRPSQGPGPFAFIGMLLPLAYFGGLIYYFSGVGGGTIKGIVDIGLGPTVAGLTIVGLLFCIKPMVVLFRFMLGADWATSRNARSGIATDRDMDDGDFNADDALARYLAKRGAGDATMPPMVEPILSADTAQGAPRAAAFGRKAV